jgi:enoyl-CoA hydratase
MDSIYPTLKYQIENNILLITLNRPEVLNALNRQVLEDLQAIFSEAKTNPSIKGIILTGSGQKAFAAGADISEIQSLDAAAALAFSKRGQQIFSEIENMPKPVIAAVNGFALGGGCELAMACHMRIAAENARFGQPEVNLGLIAGYGGTQRLTQLIGKTRAMELLLTASNLDANRAAELGLVNYVVTQDELIGKATEILHKIFSKSPVAIAETIAAVNHAGQETGYQHEAEGFSRAAASPDGKEGTQAFLEKREPKFKG